MNIKFVVQSQYVPEYEDDEYGDEFSCNTFEEAMEKFKYCVEHYGTTSYKFRIVERIIRDAILYE